MVLYLFHPHIFFSQTRIFCLASLSIYHTFVLQRLPVCLAGKRRIPDVVPTTIYHCPVCSLHTTHHRTECFSSHSVSQDCFLRTQDCLFRNKDCMLKTAQALSVLAFLCSLGSIDAVGFGWPDMTAMVVLQVVCWCCRRNKCAFYVAASFALVVAIFNAIWAAGDILGEVLDLHPVPIGDIFWVLSAGLWGAVSTLVFLFVTRPRTTGNDDPDAALALPPLPPSTEHYHRLVPV